MSGYHMHTDTQIVHSDARCSVCARFSDARPVVVIDPEDREQVERLRVAWRGSDEAGIERLQSALRSLIAPPKPDEPTRLGAVVEASVRFDDGSGFGPAQWARTGEGSWVCLTDGLVGQRFDWPFMTAVRVLSEGVTE